MNRVYLDHAATTPMRSRARAAVAEGFERWANPSSAHSEGRAARAALEDARTRIARALRLADGQLILTSGATEAITMAMKGARRRYFLAVEHETLRRAAPAGRAIPVDSGGLVDLAALDDLLQHGGGHPLVAAQAVNSETGVIQPIDRIAELVRGVGGVLFVDCAQSAGKLPLPRADIIALSAHKLGGPPGIGALWLRDPALIEAVGGQEGGYRPGTENLPAALGFAAALEEGCDWFDSMGPLRRSLDAAIADAGGEIVAGSSPRIATIGSYRMPGVPAAAQLIAFDLAGIAVSAGSACSSGSVKPSHVLAAMGWEPVAAREVIRVSFGAMTSQADVDRFAQEWVRIVERRRAA
jgi:cysteine desulfurase